MVCCVPVPDTVHLCCHDVVDALIAVWLLTLLLAQTRYSTGLVAMLLPLSPVLTGGVLCGVVLVFFFPPQVLICSVQTVTN